jgi:hypothetical protein
VSAPRSKKRACEKKKKNWAPARPFLVSPQWAASRPTPTRALSPPLTQLLQVLARAQEVHPDAAQQAGQGGQGDNAADEGQHRHRARAVRGGGQGAGVEHGWMGRGMREPTSKQGWCGFVN